MFQFNFELDDVTDDPELGIGVSLNQQSSQDQISLPSATEETCKEIPLQNLLDSLPPVISCSPLNIPLRNGTTNVTLTRRDLFDVRFQLIAEGAGLDDEGEKHASALKFIDAPSDLVPLVYEGGLKTWECSIDLVEHLDSTHGSEGFRGKHILELGCGTAIPSLYILQHIFSSPPLHSAAPTPETVLYLQDYNDSVIELVTLPNIILTWYLSPASLTYRNSNITSDEDTEELPFPTTPEPFELPISSSLKSAFIVSLKEVYNISIRLFSGSWSSFSIQLPSLHSNVFDLTLTSETIYRMDSLPSLADAMRVASFSNPDNSNNKETKGECLVAAKVLYFGVGGGVSEFICFMEKHGPAKTQVVKEQKTGVGRVILSLEFFWNSPPSNNSIP